MIASKVTINLVGLNIFFFMSWCIAVYRTNRLSDFFYEFRDVSVFVRWENLFFIGRILPLGRTDTFLNP